MPFEVTSSGLSFTPAFFKRANPAVRPPATAPINTAQTGTTSKPLPTKPPEATMSLGTAINNFQNLSGFGFFGQDDKGGLTIDLSRGEVPKPAAKPAPTQPTAAKPSGAVLHRPMPGPSGQTLHHPLPNAPAPTPSQPVGPENHSVEKWLDWGREKLPVPGLGLLPPSWRARQMAGVPLSLEQQAQAQAAAQPNFMRPIYTSQHMKQLQQAGQAPTIDDRATGAGNAVAGAFNLSNLLSVPGLAYNAYEVASTPWADQDIVSNRENPRSFAANTGIEANDIDSWLRSPISILNAAGNMGHIPQYLWGETFGSGATRRPVNNMPWF